LKYGENKEDGRSRFEWEDRYEVGDKSNTQRKIRRRHKQQDARIGGKIKVIRNTMRQKREVGNEGEEEAVEGEFNNSKRN
jgi:hypothetical protein